MNEKFEIKCDFCKEVLYVLGVPKGLISGDVLKAEDFKGVNCPDPKSGDILSCWKCKR